MKRCKHCYYGEKADADGMHWTVKSVSRPTVHLSKCPNWQPMDTPEDLGMTYEKLARRYEEL